MICLLLSGQQWNMELHFAQQASRTDKVMQSTSSSSTSPLCSAAVITWKDNLRVAGPCYRLWGGSDLFWCQCVYIHLQWSSPLRHPCCPQSDSPGWWSGTGQGRVGWAASLYTTKNTQPTLHSTASTVIMALSPSQYLDHGFFHS